MQPARHATSPGGCISEPDTRTSATRARRWIDRLLIWLDQYWEDPELRTGFWRSGW